MPKEIIPEKIHKIIVVNSIVALVLFSVLAFFIDGFVFHPIPSQGGHLTDLNKVSTEYVDASVLDKVYLSQVGEVYMVEHNEEIHLLYFRIHFPTGRYAFISDVTVEDGTNQKIVLDDGPDQVTVTIDGNKITNRICRYSVGLESGIYIVIGFLGTVCESTLLFLLLRKKHLKQMNTE